MIILSHSLCGRALRVTVLLLTLVGCQAETPQESQSSQTSQSGMPEAHPLTVETRLQALLDNFLATNADVPGVSLHVEAPRSCLSWGGATGVADRTSGVKLAPANPFRIASITKTYTAATTKAT